MALATQCPHCSTTFKVAHDQLKLRAGLVRCGACKQIFNGIEHLVPPDKLVPPQPGPSPDLAASTPAAQAAPAQRPAAAPPLAPDVHKQLPTSKLHSLVPEEKLGTQPARPPAAPPARFMPVDDPETRTMIFSPDPQTTPASPKPEEDLDEDPLTRMTLVDFTSFLEEEEEKEEAEKQAATPAETPIKKELPAPASNAAAAIAPASPPLAPEDLPEQTAAEETIWPDTNDLPHETKEDLSAGTPPATARLVDDTQADKAGHEDDMLSQTDGPEDEAFEPEESEPSDSADESDLQEEPGFVVRERRRQRRRSAMRIFMAVSSVILLAGIVAQGAYAFRGQLAAWFPATKPALSRYCEIIGCQIKLPAQIEMVSIESSELQASAADKNVFSLTLLLHNRSELTQAWPNIELSLNDGNEKPLVRRVLTPREYLPSAKENAQGFPAQSEQPVKVAFQLQDVQASGYRVYLFYP